MQDTFAGCWLEGVKHNAQRKGMWAGEGIQWARTTAESRTLLPTYKVAPARSSRASTVVRYRMSPFLQQGEQDVPFRGDGSSMGVLLRLNDPT